MGITRLKVSNFKSFDKLDLELRPLNIVVGANAAGKSNFLEIFRFLRDLLESGLENAVSLQGGIGYLANLNVGDRRNVSLQVFFRTDSESSQAPLALGVQNRKLLSARILDANYRIDISTRARAEIVGETTRYHCKLREGSLWLDGSIPSEEGEVCVSRDSHGTSCSLSISGKEEELDAWMLNASAMSEREGLMQEIRALLPKIAFYDFDPHLPKRGTPVAGSAELDSDGGNLALALKNLLNAPDRATRFARLLRDLLPFVENLRVEDLADRSLLLSLRERYSGANYLPAAFLSNGTIQVVALLLVLYFDRAGITIIEEPERNIHPRLISRVVDMMKDASTTRQIVTTTHNPELVKHADLADLLLVSRGENGFSRISRPAENEELKIFLENELGVDELYVQGLLGAGHGL
jgi:predicted ATPase